MKNGGTATFRKKERGKKVVIYVIGASQYITKSEEEN